VSYPLHYSRRKENIYCDELSHYLPIIDLTSGYQYRQSSRQG
jgi:hypothetical protein